MSELLDGAQVLDRSASRWLPGGNLQTIWPALSARRALAGRVQFQRERWDTPDGDFIDVDVAVDGAAVPATALPEAPGAHETGAALDTRPLLVLFHGLEGSSASHYAQAFGIAAAQLGWRYAVPHFRGCSGELNRAPRAYHCGDFEEIGWILQRLRQRTAAPMPVVGISLGGNALLRWAQEAGATASHIASAVAAVSSPIDMAAGGAAIDSGFNRQVYARMFLGTMKPRALLKLRQFPGLFDEQRLRAARTLYEFDDVFTAPLHGFSGTPDYWHRASAKPHLQRIGLPALVLNALNDPFVPGDKLPKPSEVGRHVTLWQPRFGGHVGFAQGAFPGQVQGLPQAVLGWMGQHLA